MRKKVIRWLGILTALIPIFYLVVGFFVLPLLIKLIALGIVNDKIVGQWGIGRIGLNPITFSASINDLKLDSESGERIFELDRVSVNVDPFAYLFAKEIRLRKLTIQGIDLNVLISENGSINVLDAVALNEPVVPETEEEFSEIPRSSDALQIPDFWIGLLSIDDIQISLKDLSRGIPFEKRIEAVNFLTKDVRNDPDLLNHFSLYVKTDGAEEIRLESDFQFNPLTIEADLDINQIRLADYSSFVEELSDVTIDDGLLSFRCNLVAKPLDTPLTASLRKGEFVVETFQTTLVAENSVQLGFEKFGVGPISLDATMPSEGSPTLKAALNLQLQGLQSQWLGQKDTLLGMETFVIDALEFELDPLSLRINQIELIAPEVSVERESDGQLKLLSLAASPPPTGSDVNVEATNDESTTAAAVTEENPIEAVQGNTETPQLPDVLIGSFRITEGIVNVTDSSVSPAADFSMTPIDLMVQNISLDPSQITDAVLSIVVDDLGEIKLDSKIVLADPTHSANLNGTIDGIPLKTFSSFASSAIGYEISDGFFSGSIKCTVDSNQLDASNEIAVETIRFGKIDPQFNGTPPPVKMAVAMLENSKGIISLDVPISGALDDPNFSILGVVSDVFRKILKNAATAPFRLATGVTGGLLSKGLSAVGIDGEKDHSIIQFYPGSDTMLAESEASLEVISELIKDRPKIALGVTGSVDPNKDVAAYSEALLDELLLKVEGSSRTEKIDQLYALLLDPESAQERALGEKVEEKAENKMQPLFRKQEQSQPQERKLSKKDGYYLASESEVRTTRQGSFYLAGERRKAFMRPIVKVEPKVKNGEVAEQIEESTALPSETELTISEKKAAILEAKYGARIQVKDLAKKRVEFIVAQLVENYSVQASRLHIDETMARKGANVIFSIKTISETKND